MHLPPVHVAIFAFRGIRPLAAAIGKPRQRVQEWARPAQAGGNDGDFPSPAIMREVHAAARARQLPLTLDDLVVGRDVPDAELQRFMESKPHQERAAWWPPLPEHAPSPAPPRGR